MNRMSFMPARRWGAIGSLWMLSGGPANACSVIPYFTMMFEGNDEHTTLMTRGFMVAMAVVVLVKTGLLEAHLRHSGRTAGYGRLQTLSGTLGAVTLANALSLLAGFSTVRSFATTGGVHILVMPLIVFLSGILWLLVLHLALRQDVPAGPFPLGWLAIVTLIGVVVYPLSTAVLLVGFVLALLSPVLVLLLVGLRAAGWLSTPANPPGETLVGEENFTNALGAICGLGLVSSILGMVLMNHLQAAQSLSVGSLAAYWVTKVVMVTLIFGIALVSTTAIEAIILLPLYRYIFLARPSDEERDARPSLAPYVRFFGDLFRINATAVIIVLFLLALRTLPVRLGNPGFLF